MRKRPTTREYPPLCVSIQRKVRFDEVDQIAYMWHGRYASWFEDGREALGEKYGMTYLTFHENNVLIPLKHFEVEYNIPLLYRHEYTIHTALLWNEAALLEYEYTILDNEQRVTTKGRTLQMMLDTQGSLLLEAPAFYKSLCEKWKEEHDNKKNCHCNSSL